MLCRTFHHCLLLLGSQSHHVVLQVSCCTQCRRAYVGGCVTQKGSSESRAIQWCPTIEAGQVPVKLRSCAGRKTTHALVHRHLWVPPCASDPVLSRLLTSPRALGTFLAGRLPNLAWHASFTSFQMHVNCHIGKRVPGFTWRLIEAEGARGAVCESAHPQAPSDAALSQTKLEQLLYVVSMARIVLLTLLAGG